jgi:CRP-like cAMP-binding protein
VLRPGDLFGESALLSKAPRNSTAVALDRGVALALDRPTFKQVLSSNPEVGARMLEQLICRLRDAEDQIEILMMRDSQSKVVIALMKLAQQVEMDSSGPPRLAISPMELSTHVGLDVDTVKRSVQQLRESEHIRIVDEHIEVTDPEALRELYSLLSVKDQILGGDARTSAKRR